MGMDQHVNHGDHVGGISNPDLHPKRRSTDPQEGDPPQSYSYTMEDMIASTSKIWDAMRLAVRVKEAPLLGLAEAISALSTEEIAALLSLLEEAEG